MFLLSFVYHAPQMSLIHSALRCCTGRWLWGNGNYNSLPTASLTWLTQCTHHTHTLVFLTLSLLRSRSHSQAPFWQYDLPQFRSVALHSHFYCLADFVYPLWLLFLAIYVVALWVFRWNMHACVCVWASDFFGYISIDAVAAAASAAATTAVLLLATTTIKSCKYVAFILCCCCFFVVFIKFFTWLLRCGCFC